MAEPYSVAVVGAGGVGGYFAVRLAQGGCRVHIVARGDHLQAIRRDGITLESICGDAQSPASAFASIVGPEEVKSIGPVDMVFVALKTWQFKDIPDVKSLVGPRTLVMPAQNGIEAPEFLAPIVGAEHVLGGWCKITSMVKHPGTIRHIGLNPPIQGTGLLPESGQWAQAELDRASAAFSACPGIKFVVEADPRLYMWRKLAGMAAYSTVCSVARCPIGPIVAIPESKATLRQDLIFDTICSLPSDNTPSMWRDFAAGRPSELYEQAGAVVRLAAKHGVPAPTLTALTSLLRPQEELHRGERGAWVDPNNIEHHNK